MSIKIALAGNPNCGKTTLFNSLTGSNQFVGNWPGVTVEKKEGKLKGNKDVFVTDLPGIYSLSPYTLEEVVARNYLVDEKPDVILNIIDGTNIERNLYLTTQLIELGIPVVVAVNMMDLVNKNRDIIKISELKKKLGCEVTAVSALKGDGIMQAAAMAVKAAENNNLSEIRYKFSQSVEQVIESVEAKINDAVDSRQKRFFAVKLLERDEKISEKMPYVPDVADEIKKIEDEMDDDTESIITNERYTYISNILKDCYKKNVSGERLTISDKIDRIVTNRWAALPIFAVVMFIVYYVSVTTVGDIVTGWTNDTLFGEWIIPGTALFLGETLHCADWLVSLVSDGIIGGVGAVLGFVPQMLILFIFLAFLEACGYMSRVAFIMDRIFRKFGLSGKSFIPMLIGSGCGVPGIMASRTIESDRDRKMTIITTTFVPCGAKVPIIALIAGACFNNAGWVAWSAYFVGVAAIVISGIILKKTRMFAGDPAPFVMELPSYHLPTIMNVLRSMWERGWSFIKKAGTIILLSTIVLWFLQGFGWVDGSFSMLEAEQLDSSILAKMGAVIAPIFRPLGWGDWKMAVAAITGLIAKENVVATFGVLFGVGAEAAEDTPDLLTAVSSAMPAISAYSFLIFNLLCAPCFAAMGAIKREMSDVKWFWFAIGYQCSLAYAVSCCVYQIGGFITGTVSFGFGTIIAVLFLIGMLYLLFRPNRKITWYNSEQAA